MVQIQLANFRAEGLNTECSELQARGFGFRLHTECSEVQAKREASAETEMLKDSVLFFPPLFCRQNWRLLLPCRPRLRS